MKLAEKIQTHLQTIYGFEIEVDVLDFLIGRDELHALTPEEDYKIYPRELFLVKAKPDEELLEIALYFDEALQANLEKNNPLEELSAENISDFCALIEGVSHFVYYIRKATQKRNVTQLELELQAEVDKYVLLSLFLQGEGMLRNQILDMLFENYYLRAELTQEQSHRYEKASDFARKYCYRLSQNLANMDYQGFLQDVRSFYPLSQNEKIQLILE